MLLWYYLNGGCPQAEILEIGWWCVSHGGIAISLSEMGTSLSLEASLLMVEHVCFSILIGTGFAYA